MLNELNVFSVQQKQFNSPGQILLQGTVVKYHIIKILIFGKLESANLWDFCMKITEMKSVDSSIISENCFSSNAQISQQFASREAYQTFKVIFVGHTCFSSGVPQYMAYGTDSIF